MEQVNGLKTLVIKSITRTVEIDSKFVSIQDVKGYFEVELKIPKHCQVYMHSKRELNDDEQILGIFQKFASEEEKSKKCLYLNLITLEPNEITVTLDCPYGERIGLPASIRVKETQSVRDLERFLSEMTACGISLQLKEPPLFSTSKDQWHLFILTPKFYAYRTLNVQIQTECKKCRKPETISKQCIIFRGSETVLRNINFIGRQLNQTIHCSCGFGMPVNLKLSIENSEITKRTELLDTPPWSDCNFTSSTYPHHSSERSYWLILKQ